MKRRTGKRFHESLRRRTTIVFASVLLMLAGLVGLGGTPALASTSCGSQSLGNYFDGYRNLGTNGMKGISDSIYVRDGALCEDAPDGAFWSGWSMVTGHNGVGYAQSGFDYTGAPGQPYYDRDFAQSSTCNGCFADSNFTTTRVYPGTAYSYWTDIGAYSEFEMYEGFTHLLGSSFSSTVLAGPFGYQLEGEVSDLGNDVPGTAGAHMGHTHLRWLNGSTWSSAMPTPQVTNQNPYRWTSNPTTNTFNTCIDGYECADTWTYYKG